MVKINREVGGSNPPRSTSRMSYMASVTLGVGQINKDHIEG